MNRTGQFENQNIKFVNNFWDHNDAGYVVIQERIKDSLRTLQELLDYYQERIQLEKEHNKKLARINKKIVLGSHETGSLKVSLEKLAHENQQMVNYNTKFTDTVASQNYNEMCEFYSNFHKRASAIDRRMCKTLKKKVDTYKHLEACKLQYQQESAQIKGLRLTVNTTLGKEQEKNRAKLNRLSSTISTTRNNYQKSIESYKDANSIYIRDWSISLSDFYILETERIQFCKINCFNFCNNIATLCVENDQSVDLARSMFAKIKPTNDLQDFSNSYGTGNKIYGEPSFVDYLNGQDELNHSSDYSIADFTNPDLSDILTRTHSTYSTANISHEAKENNRSNNTIHNQLRTPIKQVQHTPDVIPALNLPPPSSKSNDNAPKKKSPPSLMNNLNTLQGTASSVSGYSSTHEGNDIFSIHEPKENKDKLGNSNGSSNYSNPTNYTSSNYSTTSNGERNWTSPRRKGKQLSEFQEQINIKSKELPPSPIKKPLVIEKETPLVKDFSVDFIAKALEDLNAGGNGDINRYRRSVRKDQEMKKMQKIDENTFQSASDLVDDHDEVATRYGSIKFKSPVSDRKRPKSMLDPISKSDSISGDSVSTVVKTNKPRERFGSSTKSYTDLHSLINQSITPSTKVTYITKAKAKYSYKPQQQGELYFKKGWNIYVIHKQEDNWFFCELGGNCGERSGMVGLVPGNYIIEGNDLF